jgi:hypothetical protein
VARIRRQLPAAAVANLMVDHWEYPGAPNDPPSAGYLSAASTAVSAASIATRAVSALSCAVDLTEADAVERHPCVVNGRLKLTRRLLEHRAWLCVVRHHHQVPPVAGGSVGEATTRRVRGHVQAGLSGGR